MNEIEFLTIDSSDEDSISALNLGTSEEVVIPTDSYMDLWTACDTWNDDAREDGLSFTTEIESIKWEDLVSTYGVAGVAE